jgi:transposase InsO family protein
VRYKAAKDAYEETLRTRIVELALEYGRYGYRRVTQLLKREGLATNHKRVERIWFVPNGTRREESLKVPAKQPKRRRLWLTDGSCVRMRPEHPNHVWSYDIMCDRTSDGRKLRILNVIDEYTRECLAAVVERRITSDVVIETLANILATRGAPEYVRSDNGTEFTAKAVRKWLGDLGSRTLFIQPGSPWENGYVESFNGRMRDELLNGEILDTVLEAQVIVGQWVKDYNTFRPHSALNYRAPAPEAVPYPELIPVAGLVT